MMIEIIENGEYEYYGLRMDGHNYNIGDYCDESRQWMQDDPEDGSPYDPEMDCWDCGELPGTCSIRIKSGDDIARIVAYVKNTYSYAANIYLIGGDQVEYGFNLDEIIIKDAIVCCA